MTAVTILAARIVACARRSCITTRACGVGMRCTSAQESTCRAEKSAEWYRNSGHIIGADILRRVGSGNWNDKRGSAACRATVAIRTTTGSCSCHMLPCAMSHHQRHANCTSTSAPTIACAWCGSWCVNRYAITTSCVPNHCLIHRKLTMRLDLPAGGKCMLSLQFMDDNDDTSCQRLRYLEPPTPLLPALVGEERVDDCEHDHDDNDARIHRRRRRMRAPVMAALMCSK